MNLKDANSANWYDIMCTAGYSVGINKASLFDPKNADNYNYDTGIDRYGNLYDIKDKEIVCGMTIIQMLDIYIERRVLVGITNSDKVHEIIFIIYNHITKCLEYNMISMFNKITDKDMVTLENFMCAIISRYKETMRMEMVNGILKDISEGTSSISRTNSNVTINTITDDRDEFANRFRRVSNRNVDHTLTFRKFL